MKPLLSLLRTNAHTLILCALYAGTYWHRRTQAIRMDRDIEALKAHACRVEVALDRLAKLKPGKR